MKSLTRRKFLEITGAMTATGIVQACTPKTSTPVSVIAPTNTPFAAQTHTSGSTGTAAETSNPASALPYLAVAKTGEPADHPG